MSKLSLESNPYRPDIDGLRAISVISVVLFHVDPTRCPGGFVGVDVFFVISGFLITGLILRDCERNTFSLARFYERRIRRILPAVAVMQLAVLIAGVFLLFPAGLVKLSESAVAQTLMVSNFYFLQDCDYFAGPADTKPLLHTWSLAVEEQFYLVYPAAVLIWRRLQIGPLLPALAAGAVVSFISSVYGTYQFPMSTFYLLPTRAWELLLGAIVATLPSRLVPGGRLAEALSCCGLVLLGSTIIYFTSATRFPGLNALYPCLGGCFVILANSNRKTLVYRTLSLKPIVIVGLMSYSLYLWHWPILVFIRQICFQFGQVQKVAVISASFAAALVSWRFIENRFRHRDSNTKMSLAYVGAFCAIAGILLISLIVQAGEGFPSRLSDAGRQMIDDTEWIHQRRFECKDDKVTSASLPGLGQPVVDAASPDFLIWGDSHALFFASQFDRAAKRYHLSGQITSKAGYPPIIDTWRPLWRTNSSRSHRMPDWNRNVINYVRDRRIPNVVLIAAWQNYLAADEGYLSRTGDSDSTLDEARKVMREQLSATVSDLESLGSRVFIVKQVPMQEFDVGRQFRGAALYPWYSRPATGVSRKEHETRQSFMNSILQTLDRRSVCLRDPAAECFDAEGQTRLFESGRVFYLDSNHLSDIGVERMLNRFVDSILAEISQTASFTQNSPD